MASDKSKPKQPTTGTTKSNISSFAAQKKITEVKSKQDQGGQFKFGSRNRTGTTIFKSS